MRVATIATLLLASSAGAAELSEDSRQPRLEQGRELAFNRAKGNCLACHVIADGALPGNIGPPLIAMKQRFPERERLRAQIWDAGTRNPDSIMPPFGRHRILTDEEIGLLVDFLYSL